MPSPQHTVTLTTPFTWDGALARPDEVAVLRLRDDGDAVELRVSAPFHGDPPPPGSPGPNDGLWGYEVVELFIAGPGAPVPYVEVELGPHGHHLVLTLAGVRSPTARALPLDYTAERRGDRWVGVARIPRTLLPPEPWTANATAIHGQGEGRVYLSGVPLPGPAPDFHQPGRFSPLRLP
ncbi:MAG: hypothetical protein H6739_13665 [Alphaproteobacteria bacterium]|nr:hypothetical protein [Alphaproteobacteria bacterium]